MTQASTYTRQTGFADDERNNAGGRSTVLTADVDAELDSVGISLNQTIANLALIQRDDGVMRDGAVPVTALGADTLKLLSTGTAIVRGAWLTTTVYALKDLVTQSGNTYICAVPHTAGVFATDLAAVKWVLFQLGANPSATAIPFSPTPNVTSSNLQAAMVEVDTNARAREASSFASIVSNLAASAGAALVGVIHSLAGAVARTVQDRLRDFPPSFADAGAAVDGTTDNLTAVNLALATPRAEIVVKEGTDVRVSAMPTNSYGPRMGPGRVILPMTAPFPGRRQINSDTELRGHTFGQEYLYAAQVKLQARTSFTALFSGDSTTAGDALVNTYSQIHSLVQAVIRDRGFDLTSVNGGHSGATAEQWRSTYLAADLATNPDLYVIRWGINDPGWNKNGTVGTANAYEAEIANRRDITDYAATMRTALTTIRAAKTVAQMSIILMVPNSTSDSPNGRDEKWYEQCARVLRKCARDFQCTFIDTYAIWRDSRGAASLWMDNAYGDGRAIHPLDIMNNWIASAIGDLIVPSALAVRNISSSFANPVIGTLPAAFPIGASTFRAVWTINGVAMNGMVITHRGADGICMQEVVDYLVQRRVARRIGNSGGNVWQDWISTPTNTTVLTLSNGWTSSGRGITYDKEGGLVHIRGRLTGGTLTTGTIIATLPAGFWPVFDEYRAVQCGAGLTTSASILISSTDGTIRINSVASNTLLDIGCTFSIF